MKNPEQIPQFMRQFLNKKLRVGFSGGADSSALLLLLLRWGFVPDRLEAVHFDHGLRGEASRSDAIWCREFCTKLKVGFTLVELDLQAELQRGGSVEDIARNARLEWYVKHDDSSPIVLAHHRGDCREDLLLKLARGGNASALSALREQRSLRKLTILRPLLDWQKEELEAFLLDYNINDWRLDESNKDILYHRNFLRNVLLKQWAEYHPAVISGLERSRQALQLDADFIEQCAAERLQELGPVPPLETQAEFWRKLHPALLVRVLRSYLAALEDKDYFLLNRQMLNNFQSALQLVPSPEKRCIELGQGRYFILQNDRLSLKYSTVDNLPETLEWQWQKADSIQWGYWQLHAVLSDSSAEDNIKSDAGGRFYFDADSVPEKLYISPRRGGEKMSVWGSSGMRRVKHLLSAVADKENIPILHDAAGNIYSLGAWRRSQLAPITADCRRILCVEFFRKGE